MPSPESGIMALDPIRFGTDGWRGRIAEDYTFDAVRRCAQGFATYLLTQGNPGKPIVVGFDKRFDSEHFAAAAAEVLAGNGLDVLLTQSATPTPVISYAVVSRHAIGGVNITASHNPSTDNGFKVRDLHGGAVAPEGLKKIEAAIPDDLGSIRRTPIAEAKRDGKITEFDPTAEYVAQIERLVDLDPIRQAGLTLVADAMWGNGAGWFPRLLDGGKTQVIEIHDIRNPLFPEMVRPEPIPPNVDVGLKATLDHQADVLLVTDGDADRLGLGDEKGVFIDQLRAYALLAYYMLEIRGERGPIVKTLSTTSMLTTLGQLYDVPVYETGVGFKYVAPKMLEVNAMIGGEESGGYAFRDHVPERDGILAGLYFLDLMVRTGKKPSELIQTLFERVGPHYYKRIDTPLPQGERQVYEKNISSADPAQVGGLKVVGKNHTDGYKFLLEDGGWLLVRFSGTEPIVRVYCETTDSSRVDPILDDGIRLAGIE
jgi:phosphomannomutase